MNERNKIQFIYEIVDEILNFIEDDNACFISYFFIKYACYYFETLRINLVEKIDLKSYPHLKNKISDFAKM